VNPHAAFRDGREEAICHAVENKGRLLLAKMGFMSQFV